MVYDSEDGLVGIYDDYNEALIDYEKYKQIQKEYVQNAAEFTCDERVILAEIKKYLYPYETNNKAIGYDKDGNEIELDENIWDWKELNY